MIERCQRRRILRRTSLRALPCLVWPIGGPQTHNFIFVYDSCDISSAGDCKQGPRDSGEGRAVKKEDRTSSRRHGFNAPQQSLVNI